jgi:hypothetical protein
MRKSIQAAGRWLAVVAGLGWVAEADAQRISAFTVRPLAEGLQQPYGVAVHPGTGEIYVSELGANRIVVLRNNRPEPALPAGWTVSEELPRWAISARVPLEKWMAATIQKPGPLSISTNGTLYVAEQIPDGRLLQFPKDAQGNYSVATAVPVPWLDQEFQWRDLYVDSVGRLFVAGADEVGSDFMKFGSCLVRQPDGEWWVIDFGPFAYFYAFALSEKADVMILGDRNKGTLSWWEVDRQMMLGGTPGSTGRSDLQSVAVYPDGSFVLGQIDGPGQASIVRMDPFTGQQTTLAGNLQSIGAIAMDRANARFIVTDPAAGRVLECVPNPPMRYNEAVMRQIVRSVDGMIGVVSEAPAFLNNFFDRLQSAAQELMPEDSTHSLEFNLSDIAGKMPVVAGRVRAEIEVEGAEEDPLEQIEFFLLFPSQVVMTDETVTPSLSFFTARRKSGKIEQTRPLFSGNVGVYRMSGTNFSRIASAAGGIHVPVVTCGIEQTEGGVNVNLTFLGAGVYGDYYLTLFQGPREQTGKLVVKSATSDSGLIAYEASFMDEATIEGVDGTITKEELSNLLIAGFQPGGGVNRSVGWLRIGQFPAAMTVAFGDAGETPLTGAQSDLREIVEQRRVEMSLEAASDIDALETGEIVDDGGAAEAPETPNEAEGGAGEPAPSAEGAAP